MIGEIIKWNHASNGALKVGEGYTMKGTEKQHLSQICKIMCLLENLIWDNNTNNDSRK
jgi:hypothetical protein